MKQLKVGDSAHLTKTIVNEDVRTFAAISEDKNPVHLDPEYAKNSIFKKPIAHGLLVASYISAVLANHLPGPGSIYLEQNLSFRRPVFIGDTITATVCVVEFPKPTHVRLSTICTNQDGTVVIEGTALVKVS